MRCFIAADATRMDPPYTSCQVKLSWRLTKLEKAADGVRYVATYDTPDGAKTVVAKAVVSTAPAHALKDVLSPVLPGAAVSQA